MKNLKVKIDNNSGFCFGVEFAIEMAEDITDVEKATQEYEGYKIENVANFS